MEQKIGLYIDADNISHKYFSKLLNKINLLGNVIIKKIYGDWSKINMTKWCQTSKKNGLEAIQCFRHNQKQSTDIYLITNLMQDLYLYPYIDIIILVSSDSDFCSLAQCIKKLNKKLIIVGHSKSYLKTFANEYWNINNFKKTYKKTTNNLIDAMNYNNIISKSQFKKNLNNIIKNKMSWNEIVTELNKNTNIFKIYSKKKRTYIIYILELLNYNSDEFKNNSYIIKQQYYDILKIISFDKLYNILYK